MPFSIVWEAPEFEYREKSVSWYWISIIVAALMVAFSVWERNILFGLFIIIAEILVISWANQQPNIFPVVLNEEGLAIGHRKFHALREFDSWSADHVDDTWAELSFHFKTHVKIPLRVLAPHDQLEEIRKNLRPIVKEIDHQASLIDAIEKLLNF
jgi:hypothetical protein